MTIHIHDITLPGDSEFAEKFNHCSMLWQQANDPNLTQEERDEAYKNWLHERQRLEFGL